MHSPGIKQHRPIDLAYFAIRILKFIQEGGVVMNVEHAWKIIGKIY